jgi:hypothetical protein
MTKLDRHARCAGTPSHGAAYTADKLVSEDTTETADLCQFFLHNSGA